MRSLVWFSIGFSAACLLGGYFLLGSIAYYIAAVCLVLAVILFAIPSVFSTQAIVATIALGISLGSFWMENYQSMHLQPARAMDDAIISGSIEVSEYSYPTGKGIGTEGYLSVNGRQYKVRLYLQDVKALSPGDKVFGKFQLYYSGKSSYKVLESEGIGFQVFVNELEKIVPAKEVPLKYLPVLYKQRITQMLQSVFPEDTLGFAKALLLGDSSDLSYTDDLAFRNSGIRHIIAVSGLHVSILFSLILFVFGKRRFLTTAVGLPVLLLFAAVAGFTPSVSRACLMQGLVLLGLAFDKEYDPPTGLAFAVTFLLFQNPMTATSIGFQLSVSCVAGIFLFHRRIHDFLMKEKRLGPAKGKTLKSRLVRWFVGSVSMSVGALAFTLPLSALYFGSISLLGVISNLLTLWAVSIVFYGILLSCVLGAIWLPLGQIVAWVVSWGMRYVLLVAKLIGDLPISNVPADNVYMVLWLAFFYFLCILFWKSKKRRLWLLAVCAAFSFALCVFFSVSESRIDQFRVTVLDVGQGQCILLQSGNQCYMVDCGGDSPKKVASLATGTLWSNGIYRLDGLILTHYDEDHVGTIEPLLAQFSAEDLYMPISEDKQNLQTSIINNFNGAVHYVESIITVPCGEGTITVIPASSDAKGNESSLCILFQAADCDILITGDRNRNGEAQLLEQFALPDLEVLVVGHHGSKSSTGLPLLNATMPEVAVISVGEDNLYSHPEQETLERLTLFGCEILRTDLLGTIIIRR